VNALPYGWDGVLLEVDNPAAWFGYLVNARDAGELDCDEIVPAAATVLLRGVRRVPDLSRVRPDPAAIKAREVVLPVWWDGEDFGDVADRWRDDPAVVLTTLTFTVAFCGFAPGFAYLTGLPGRYHVPRLSTPRAKVPAGAVAVAGPYAGVYPRSSPGGWRLLGHTEVTLFDAQRDEPALLTPGTRVRFANA
jgi:KipI family sensor histidine kinase inhibitor